MARASVARRKNHVSNFRDDIFKIELPVVYFVGTAVNELVKIGYSKGFRERFIHMASGSPVPLMVCGVLTFQSLEDAKKAERAIQMMLAKGGRHSHGEWYRLPMSGIEALAKHFSKLGVSFISASVSSCVDEEPESNYVPLDASFGFVSVMGGN